MVQKAGEVDNLQEVPVVAVVAMRVVWREASMAEAENAVVNSVAEVGGVAEERKCQQV